MMKSDTGDGQTFYSARELDALARKHEREMRKKMFIRGRWLTIKADRHDYCIELVRLDSHEKILEWVHHLSGKVWITPELIGRFIRLACEHHKLKLYVNA